MTRLPSTIRLHVVGEGPMRAQWETLTLALGLNNRVEFLGRVADEHLPEAYRAADLFVLPANNRAEAFGMVLVEAMASGLPCITTEIGSGNSYVVQNGVTGLVVPPRSPEALAEAITRLVSDPALRAQMGQAGRERALREFTVETMIDRVEAVYKTAVTSGRR